MGVSTHCCTAATLIAEITQAFFRVEEESVLGSVLDRDVCGVASVPRKLIQTGQAAFRRLQLRSRVDAAHSFERLQFSEKPTPFDNHLPATIEKRAPPKGSNGRTVFGNAAPQPMHLYCFAYGQVGQALPTQLTSNLETDARQTVSLGDLASTDKDILAEQLLGIYEFSYWRIFVKDSRR